MRSWDKVIGSRPVRSWSMAIPDGDAGVAVTIRLMQGAAAAGAVDPRVRELALGITRNVPSRDSAGEIAAVYDWVKHNIRFRGEYDEVVQSPDVTARWQAGDCDDHTVLIAALLGSLGYKVRFQTVAVRGERDLSHVYAEVQDPNTGQWEAMDTTVRQAYPGWRPPDITREKNWKGIGDMRAAVQRHPQFRRMRGLGDDVAQAIAQDVNAAMPLVDTIANIQAQDYNRNLLYNRGRGGSSGAIGINYFPGGATITGSSSVPGWVWLGGGLLFAAVIFSGRRGRR